MTILSLSHFALAVNVIITEKLWVFCQLTLVKVTLLCKCEYNFMKYCSFLNSGAVKVTYGMYCAFYD